MMEPFDLAINYFTFGDHHIVASLLPILAAYIPNPTSPTRHLHAMEADDTASLTKAFGDCDDALRKALPAKSEAGTTATLARVQENGSDDSLNVVVPWLTIVGSSVVCLQKLTRGDIICNDSPDFHTEHWHMFHHSHVKSLELSEACLNLCTSLHLIISSKLLSYCECAILYESSSHITIPGSQTTSL